MTLIAFDLSMSGFPSRLMRGDRGASWRRGIHTGVSDYTGTFTNKDWGPTDTLYSCHCFMFKGLGCVVVIIDDQ